MNMLKLVIAIVFIVASCGDDSEKDAAEAPTTTSAPTSGSTENGDSIVYKVVVYTTGVINGTVDFQVNDLLAKTVDVTTPKVEFELAAGTAWELKLANNLMVPLRTCTTSDPLSGTLEADVAIQYVCKDITPPATLQSLTAIGGDAGLVLVSATFNTENDRDIGGISVFTSTSAARTSCPTDDAGAFAAADLDVGLNVLDVLAPPGQMTYVDVCIYDTSLNARLVNMGLIEIPNYRIFATSSLQTGNLSGLSGADNICQNLADAQVDAKPQMKGVWRALLSDSSSSLTTRLLLPSAANFYGTTNVLVATGSQLLSPPWSSAASFDEAGAAASGFLYSGSNNTGTARNNNCLNWTSSSAGQQGDGSVIGDLNSPMYDGSSISCGTPGRRIYCINGQYGNTN